MVPGQTHRVMRRGDIHVKPSRHDAQSAGERGGQIPLRTPRVFGRASIGFWPSISIESSGFSVRRASNVAPAVKGHVDPDQSWLRNLVITPDTTRGALTETRYAALP